MRSRSLWRLQFLLLISGMSLASHPASIFAASSGDENTTRLATVRRLLRQTPLIDGHNDVPWQYRKKNGDLNAINLAADTSQPPLSMVTDIPRLRAGCVGGQFWSVYIPSLLEGPVALQAVVEQIDIVHRMVARYPDTFAMAYTADDIEREHKRGRIASLIGMEGGHSINNSLASLRMLYQLGARYMTLTHVKNNDWADAAGDQPRHHGLSPFGEDVVREMNRLGMLVALSHVSDDTMRPALRITKAPVIFSHSSARALCGHHRNVPDDILSLTATNGGVVMVAFLPAFIVDRERADSEAWQVEEDRVKAAFPDNEPKLKAARVEWRKSHPEPPPATLEDVANHIDHIRSQVGADHIGIGSDFDGYSGATRGLEDVSCYPALFAELLRRGYSAGDIRKIAGQNLLRVLRQAEEVSRKLQKESARS